MHQGCRYARTLTVTANDMSPASGNSWTLVLASVRQSIFLITAISTQFHANQAQQISSRVVVVVFEEVVKLRPAS